MRLGTFLSGVAVLGAAVAAKGQDVADAWTDEAIWVTVSETYGFEQKLRGIIFDNEDVRQQIRRAGVMSACRRIADFIDQRASAVSEDYRALIVAEARAMVPEGRTFHEQISIHPSGHRFGRLIESVERKAPELFVDLPARIETELLTELAKMPMAEGEWRGPVADWSLMAQTRLFGQLPARFQTYATLRTRKSHSMDSIESVPRNDRPHPHHQTRPREP